MAFEGLADKLQETFKKLRGKGKLNEKRYKRSYERSKACIIRS